MSLVTNLGSITLSDSDDSDSDQLNIRPGHRSAPQSPPDLPTQPSSSRAPQAGPSPAGQTKPTFLNKLKQESPIKSPTSIDDDNQSGEINLSDEDVELQRAILASATANHHSPTGPTQYQQQNHHSPSHSPVASTSRLNNLQPYPASLKEQEPSWEDTCDFMDLDDDDHNGGDDNQADDDDHDDDADQFRPSPSSSARSSLTQDKGKGKARETDSAGQVPVPTEVGFGPVLPRPTQYPSPMAQPSPPSRSSSISVESVKRPKRRAARVEQGHYDDRKGRRKKARLDSASQPKVTKKQSTAAAGKLLSAEIGPTITLPPFVRQDHTFTPQLRDEFVSKQLSIQPKERMLCGPVLPGEFDESGEFIEYAYLYEQSQRRFNQGKVNRIAYTKLFETMINEANRKELNGKGRIRVILQPGNVDERSPPFEFNYTNKTIYSGEFLPYQAKGCDCKGDCGDPANLSGCACRERQEMSNRTRKFGQERSNNKGFAYHKNGM